MFIEIAKDGNGHIIELPLQQVLDVSGSKIGVLTGIKTLLELVPIRRSLRQWALQPH
jgi:hypothetical protein